MNFDGKFCRFTAFHGLTKHTIAIAIGKRNFDERVCVFEYVLVECITYKYIVLPFVTVFVH